MLDGHVGGHVNTWLAAPGTARRPAVLGAPIRPARRTGRPCRRTSSRRGQPDRDGSSTTRSPTATASHRRRPRRTRCRQHPSQGCAVVETRHLCTNPRCNDVERFSAHGLDAHPARPVGRHRVGHVPYSNTSESPVWSSGPPLHLSPTDKRSGQCGGLAPRRAKTVIAMIVTMLGAIARKAGSIDWSPQRRIVTRTNPPGRRRGTPAPEPFSVQPPKMTAAMAMYSAPPADERVLEAPGSRVQK